MTARIARQAMARSSVLRKVAAGTAKDGRLSVGLS